MQEDQEPYIHLHAHHSKGLPVWPVHYKCRSGDGMLGCPRILRLGAPTSAGLSTFRKSQVSVACRQLLSGGAPGEGLRSLGSHFPDFLVRCDQVIKTISSSGEQRSRGCGPCFIENSQCHRLHPRLRYSPGLQIPFTSSLNGRDGFQCTL